MVRSLIVIALLWLPACGPGAKGGPSMNNKIGGPEVGPPVSPVVSADIMARDPIANDAQVKHILIGWKDLADQYDGRIDKRAAARTKADAETEVKSLVGQLRAGAEFDTLMKAHSEDPGSAQTARPYTVTPDAQLVIEFRQLSLRLKVDEIGVVESDFGFHIIKRLF
ncbi:MAG: peptidylprolyl isomerase [Deltaproteobacteria bacterium]|nr:peptidylprolyl isomerase [Deltaproteobacteria bacterium]MDQ3295947.1 peptidyl-prolyl cis-trans isomerase [Myxococcota bacterium]